jgi:hypothetical protein
MRKLGVALSAFVLGAALIGGVASASAGRARPIARGGHVSGVARPEARLSGRLIHAGRTSCTQPGSTNYMADCNSQGYPVNETWIALNGNGLVAGANDYNSYNGNADLGYYTSPDGKTWTDNGPLDLFPQGTNHAAGDPGLAADLQGVVYYSSIYFDYFDCSIGGVELARRDPSTGTWSYYQIRGNSDSEFQDKPAVAVDRRHVYVSWTRYGSCSGVGVTSPIKIAVFPLGSNSGPPIGVLSVPGSTYSQGSAIVTDKHGGLWVAWEEFPAAGGNGSIWLAHWRGPSAGWASPFKITDSNFKDLPSPLPGFAFRDNSFPAIAIHNGAPNVVWCSYDTGKGRCYWWVAGAYVALSDTGGDQFFPSIVVDTAAQFSFSWSQTNQANQSFDQFERIGGNVTKISTASSFPNQDQFFGGAFIGDYNGIARIGTVAHPIWTDLRRNDPLGGKAQDAMVYSP